MKNLLLGFWRDFVDFYAWAKEWSHEHDPASWAGHALQAVGLMLLTALFWSLAVGAYAAFWVFAHRELPALIGRASDDEEKIRDGINDYFFPVAAAIATAACWHLASPGTAYIAGLVAVGLYVGWAWVAYRAEKVL